MIVELAKVSTGLFFRPISTCRQFLCKTSTANRSCFPWVNLSAQTKNPSYAAPSPNGKRDFWRRFMSDLALSVITLVIIFGSALIGMLLRAALPAHHLRDESRDVLKLGIALAGIGARHKHWGRRACGACARSRSPRRISAVSQPGDRRQRKAGIQSRLTTESRTP